MKILAPLLVLLAAPLMAVPSSADQPPANPLFKLTPDYRGVVTLDESLISPFRKPEARALQAANLSVLTTGPNISAVLTKFKEMRLSGVIPSTSKRTGVIILGDQVFKEGEELSFPGKTTRLSEPLLEGHRVKIRSITGEGLSLAVELLSEGGTPKIVPFGLLDYVQD